MNNDDIKTIPVPAPEVDEEMRLRIYTSNLLRLLANDVREGRTSPATMSDLLACLGSQL